jgi:hypothetical protein
MSETMCDALETLAISDSSDIPNKVVSKNARSYRCSVYNSSRNNVCKRKMKSPKKIHNKNLCAMHYKLACTKTAIVIQKNYKGHRIREKINNIYKKLPCELQYRILFYIKQDHYYNMYLKTIGRIAENKIVNGLNLVSNNLYVILSPTYLDNLHTYLTNNKEDLLHILNMFLKYYSVIKDNNKIKNYCYNLQIKFIYINNKITSLNHMEDHFNPEYSDHEHTNYHEIRNEIFDIIYNIRLLLARCVTFQNTYPHIII